MRTDRVAPWLFAVLMTVEVVRQRSFWLTVLGDGWLEQVIAVGTAVGFSGCQWYLAHHFTRQARTYLEARDGSARLLTLTPLAAAWFLQVVAVGVTTALDVGMRLGRHPSPARLLTAAGLSEQDAEVILLSWGVLVTVALLAGLTAIGIRTADGAEEHRAAERAEHERELLAATDSRNH